jgi:Spy/CpxP family protein refolding chaperone
MGISHPSGLGNRCKLMRIRAVITVLAGCALAGQALAADMSETAYAGQQGRAIKALSDEEIAALRKGEGMGMAKAAELNGYPGPLHVLALMRDLRLTETQINQVTAIRDRMSATALPLGAELIERERLLDGLFAQGRITPERLTAETAAIGEIQGRLRAAHLGAHLETRAILSPEQVARYTKLRGCDGTSGSDHSHPVGHRH